VVADITWVCSRSALRAVEREYTPDLFSWYASERSGTGCSNRRELQISIVEIAVLLIVVIIVATAAEALWRNAEGSQRAVGVAAILVVGPLVAIIAIVSYAVNHP
jgi:hypothetical protein